MNLGKKKHFTSSLSLQLLTWLSSNFGPTCQRCIMCIRKSGSQFSQLPLQVSILRSHPFLRWWRLSHPLDKTPWYNLIHNCTFMWSKLKSNRSNRKHFEKSETFPKALQVQPLTLRIPPHSKADPVGQCYFCFKNTDTTLMIKWQNRQNNSTLKKGGVTTSTTTQNAL